MRRRSEPSPALLLALLATALLAPAGGGAEASANPGTCVEEHLRERNEVRQLVRPASHPHELRFFLQRGSTRVPVAVDLHGESVRIAAPQCDQTDPLLDELRDALAGCAVDVKLHRTESLCELLVQRGPGLGFIVEGEEKPSGAEPPPR